MGKTQTLGGRAGFNFLNSSTSPQLTALGGMNLSAFTKDGSVAVYNPALMRPFMNSQLSAAFGFMQAGTKSFQLSQILYHSTSFTSFSGMIQYFNYGSIPSTDASGNITGSIKPAEYAIQIGASRKYMERWHYGVHLKFIGSSLGQYRSGALAADIGVCYADSANGVQAGVLVKNMGFQVKKYLENVTEELPFDLQMGVTYKFAEAPLQISLTGHHLHQFDIRYNDTVYNNANDIIAGNTKAFSLDNIFRHFVVSAQLLLENKIEITAAYNHLRRRELNIYDASNGLNGFSMGAGLILEDFQLRYSRSYFQSNSPINQLGIHLLLSRYF